MIILVSGCAAEPASDDKEKTLNSQFAELQKRPDIDSAVQRYGEVLTKIRDRLAASNFATGWREAKDRASSRGCTSGFSGAWSEIDDETGEIRTLPTWISSGNLPDEKWDSAVSAIVETVRDHGFDGPGVVANRPGDHEVIFRDGYGAQITFGTLTNTVLSLTTGCHLTVAAHQRGTPPPKRTY
ncbi:LppA family lipoprotein [Kibdelosporangium phytohabitans]|uniref:LppA family lipoprotein n=1 Tax=Kibdelosporangium phytohabitans TaxID=860235 RepID=UPI0014704B65|nr:LppA family lipoprotein [Kibdelosporangium phytohabitans]MBE1467682.1 hypothetical protein [Kibdelosporangium phytohabitans]